MFFTDIHARVEWETPAALLKATAAINAVQPKLVICGGDMIAEGYILTPAMILVSHMPLLTGFYQLTEGLESPVPSNRCLVVNNREVLAAFGSHPARVLQGHLHVNELLRWRGTTFITGGAICGKWWRGDFHGTEPGFGVLHLRPDRVDWEYHGYDWVSRRPTTA